MKKLFLSLIILISFVSFSQENNYKYAVLPAKFSFLNEANKYNLNSLTKAFFESQGYEVYYDTDTMSNDIANNNCNKIYINVLENNSVFQTKLSIEIKDCKNQVLLTSTEGKSREKEFRVAYNNALREAVNSIKGKLTFENPYLKNDIASVIKPVKVEEKVIETVIDNKKEIVSSYKLSAVPNQNGYKLVDSDLKVLFELFKTSKPNIFIAKKDTISGVFFSNNNEYFFEFFQNDKLVSEKVDVKF
jgi:hypothetical protein